MVIPSEVLRGPAPVALLQILIAASKVEKGRVERTLNDADVSVFLAAVARHPAARIRVYAGRGAFAPNSRKYNIPMTIVEYCPADENGGEQTVVTECDARRPGGKGPWLTVNGEKEI